MVAFPASVKHKIIAIVAGFFFSAGPEYRPHYLAVLPGPMELHRVRVVPPLPVAGATYADFGACPPLVLVIASVAAMEGPRC